MVNIMVVEDEKPISNLIALSLKKAGYHSECAYDGLEAIDMLEKNYPDLILLDIMLPGADGFEILEYVKPLEIPVIFLTAKGDLNDRVNGLRYGAEDYIVKPFVKEVLLARVEMHLERSAKETGKSFADAAIEKNRGEIQKKLTPIEWKIALAVAQGMENREIAEQMNYSYGYVKNVIARIFSKLEIERRRELRKLLIG